MSNQFNSFAETYLTNFTSAITGLDRAALGDIMKVLADARANDRTVFVAGNGGSAAIANHFECDATKGTYVPGKPVLRSHSLAANTSVLTALANDIGFEAVFEKQVEYYGKPRDVLVLVSSSGNSANVVNACSVAKARGLVTVALVGFKGGRLKDMADHVLHVAVENYGIVEDMHQAIIHLISQFLKETA
jgi:D-sedoheptulose 7-phosphate isomerase